MQSALLDFKVFYGRTTGELTCTDVESVLDEFKDETTVLLGTIGITDETGNMGKLGACFQENDRRHACCVDHNGNRCAQLAFDREFVFL